MTELFISYTNPNKTFQKSNIMKYDVVYLILNYNNLANERREMGLEVIEYIIQKRRFHCWSKEEWEM